MDAIEWMRSNTRQRSSTNGTTVSQVTRSREKDRSAIPVQFGQLRALVYSTTRWFISTSQNRLAGSSRCSTSWENFLALSNNSQLGEIHPVLRASTPSCQLSARNQFWAVTHHLTGHTRVRGFHVSATLYMDVCTCELPKSQERQPLVIAGDIRTPRIVNHRNESTKAPRGYEL